MWKDPIVEECRKAGRRLFKKCGNDPKKFGEYLRKRQKQHSPGRVVDLSSIEQKQTASRSKKQKTSKSRSTSPALKVSTKR